MNKLGVVIGEVYRKNVKSVSFVVMVLSPILMMLVFGAIGYFMGKDVAGTQDAAIALVSNDITISQTLSNAVTTPKLTTVSSEAEAQKQLADGNVDGYLVLEVEQEQIHATYFSQTTDKKVNLAALNQALSNLQLTEISQRLNLTSEQLASVQEANITIAEQEIKFDDAGKAILASDAAQAAKQSLERNLKIGAAYVVSILIFMFVMSYSGIIAQEIASEKGTRIMEVILSSISATTHFVGKVIGIMLVMVTQVVLYGVMGVIAYHIPVTQQLMKQYLPNVDVIGIIGPVLWLAVAFFVMGVLIYVSLSAFVGSLVTKSEDVQKVTSPVALIGIVGYYVGMYAVANPNNIAVQALSYVPLWTPFVMPFRIASDTVTPLQLGIASALLVVGTIAIIAVSVVFYRSNVLIYSDTNFWNKVKRSWTILRSERR